ncbi:3-hydroxyisobutyryl-CoA hydrolase, mitochondrial-like isoform X2 [Watersipora subatra]
MVIRLHKQLKVWEDDPSVSMVIFKGAGEKMFCAGGDVRELSEHALRDHQDEASCNFLINEYNSQYTIATYRKPLIVLVNGYALGAGCAIAANAAFSVATENAVMSMPEAAIGFYPDNGGSHFLSHLPGALGMYLGLTCAQVIGEDTCKIGLTTHYTTAFNGEFNKLEEELLTLADPSTERVAGILSKYHKKCATDQPMSLQPHLSRLNRIFRLDSVEQIMQALREDNSDWAQEALSSISSKSPTLLKVIHRMLREASSLNFSQCIAMEFRIGRNILHNHDSDFSKGVKAVLVKKTAKAEWNPSNIEEVNAELVESHFLSSLNEFQPEVK